MADRRRIHRRDGARHWTLMRDLADPRLWIERYHLPTWLDYMRHNQRMTQVDIAITDHARALHRGEGRPRVSRLIARPTRLAPPGDRTRIGSGQSATVRVGMGGRRMLKNKTEDITATTKESP